MPLLLLAGMMCCILLSQIFFGVLQWFTFEKNFVSITIAPYRLMAVSLGNDVKTNLHMGKTLSRFRHFSALSADLMRGHAFVLGTRLIRPDGSVANRYDGGYASPGDLERERLPRELPAGELATVETSTELHILQAVSGNEIFDELGVVTKDEVNKGFLDVVVDKSLYTPILRKMLRQFLTIMGFSTVGMMAVVWLLFYFFPIRKGAEEAESRDGEKKKAPLFRHGRVLGMVLLPLMSGQIALSTLSFNASYEISEEAMRASTRGYVEVLADKVQRVLDLGVRLDELSDLNPYLRKLVEESTAVGAFYITGGQGVEYSFGKYDGNAGAADRYVKPLRNSAGNVQAEVGAVLNFALLRNLARALLLDLGTTFVISVLLMLECVLLTSAAAPGGQARRKDDTSRAFLRGLAFFYYFAIDLSISFVPLCMKQFFQGGGSPSALMSGLPISAEMASAGVAMLFIGLLSSRLKPVTLLALGLALTTAGNLNSALAPTPAAYVLARALVGLGYGFALMSMQNMVVAASSENTRGANVALFFVGVYAGGVCGSALGGMLAERFGFAAVFALSAAMTLLLLLPILFRRAWWSPGERRKEGERREGCEKARFSWRGVSAFLGNREIAALFLLVVVPCSVINVGVINFLIPYTLEEAGVSQSDIGRLFMLCSLLFIVFGSRAGVWVETAPRKTRMVTLGALLGALSLFFFALPAPWLTPFWCAFGAVCLIGLATAVNIPAQVSFLLGRPSSARIGSESSLSLYTFTERLGQVGGPLFFGSAMLLFGGGTFALLGGGVALGSAFLFRVLARERE